jgi:hypothetical protein
MQFLYYFFRSLSAAAFCFVYVVQMFHIVNKVLLTDSVFLNLFKCLYVTASRWKARNNNTNIIEVNIYSLFMILVICGYFWSIETMLNIRKVICLTVPTSPTFTKTLATRTQHFIERTQT